MRVFWVILALGISIRLFLAATTFHSDLQAFNLGGFIVASGHLLDLYDYHLNLPEDNPMKEIAVLNYPPLIYLFHGLFNFLFSIFGLWQVNHFILDQVTNYGNLHFNLHLLLLKLPYLIPDLIIAFLLMGILENKRQGIFAFAFWMLNPVNLYATYMMGQFDIIPTMFTVAAVYFIAKSKWTWAAILLGLGIAFKIYPLFLLLGLIALVGVWKERVKLLILGLLPYLISILPYWHSVGFKQTALFASQNTKSLYASIPVSGGESLLLFPLFLIFFYLVMFVTRVGKNVLETFTVVLLLFFIFTHYHPQWFLWITPFLIIVLVRDYLKVALPVTIMFISYVGLLFFFEPSLTMEMFAPLFPTLKGLPPVWTLLNINVDYNLSRSLLQTIFAAASFYLIYLYFPKNNNG